MLTPRYLNVLTCSKGCSFRRRVVMEVPNWYSFIIVYNGDDPVTWATQQLTLVSADTQIFIGGDRDWYRDYYIERSDILSLEDSNLWQSSSEDAHMGLVHQTINTTRIIIVLITIYYSHYRDLVICRFKLTSLSTPGAEGIHWVGSSWGHDKPPWQEQCHRQRCLVQSTGWMMWEGWLERQVPSLNNRNEVYRNTLAYRLFKRTLPGLIGCKWSQLGFSVVSRARPARRVSALLCENFQFRGMLLLLRRNFLRRDCENRKTVRL